MIIIRLYNIIAWLKFHFHYFFVMFMELNFCTRDTCGMHNFVSLNHSMWPRDAIWRHRSVSTKARVMACCPSIPSQYPNQCWLIISEVQRQSPEANFTRYTAAINSRNSLENNVDNFIQNIQGTMSWCYYYMKTTAAFELFHVNGIFTSHV